MFHSKKQRAFTLIELSIVLVIIGLIVGGVLVGKDLIEAAKIRSQISQIEKYNVAANTFRVKYNCLPGDCKNAAQFGFPARGAYRGQGDGDGVLESSGGNSNALAGGVGGAMGETVTFWVDLSMSGLINESFTIATSNTCVAYVDKTTSPAINDYFPKAKIGDNNVAVYSSGVFNPPWSNWQSQGLNFFLLQIIGSVSSCGMVSIATPGILGVTTQQAFAMDTKMDDGMPQSGKVLARYIWGQMEWAGVSSGRDTPPGATGTPTTAATSASNSTCYDNGNTAGQSQRYSTSVNNGAVNCGLSFQFQ